MWLRSDEGRAVAQVAQGLLLVWFYERDQSWSSHLSLGLSLGHLISVNGLGLNFGSDGLGLNDQVGSVLLQTGASEAVGASESVSGLQSEERGRGRREQGAR